MKKNCIRRKIAGGSLSGPRDLFLLNQQLIEHFFEFIEDVSFRCV
jgi:hypothetical protein